MVSRCKGGIDHISGTLSIIQESDPFKADSIMILPVAHNGAGTMCNLERNSSDRLFFAFQKKKYLYNETSKRFEKLDYLHSNEKPMSFFKNYFGLNKAALVDFAKEKYGMNKFEVPIPSFQELFKEHMLAPFFIFQVFCVGLWFLDDMWYYSLFTLFMLMVFEATVVFQVLYF